MATQVGQISQVENCVAPGRRRGDRDRHFPQDGLCGTIDEMRAKRASSTSIFGIGVNCEGRRPPRLNSYWATGEGPRPKYLIEKAPQGLGARSTCCGLPGPRRRVFWSEAAVAGLQGTRSPARRSRSPRCCTADSGKAVQLKLLEDGLQNLSPTSNTSSPARRRSRVAVQVLRELGRDDIGVFLLLPDAGRRGGHRRWVGDGDRRTEMSVMYASLALELAVRLLEGQGRSTSTSPRDFQMLTAEIAKTDRPTIARSHLAPPGWKTPSLASTRHVERGRAGRRGACARPRPPSPPVTPPWASGNRHVRRRASTLSPAAGTPAAGRFETRPGASALLRVRGHVPGNFGGVPRPRPMSISISSAGEVPTSLFR